jgi:hypothetical protein
MSDVTSIVFPGGENTSHRDYDSWMAWVECELSILGHDIAAQCYDWRSAFKRGLKPEAAAHEAAALAEQD